MITKIIAWLVWVILLVTFLIYIPILRDFLKQPEAIPAIPSIDKDHQILPQILLMLTALLVAAASICLRHFLLIKPFKAGISDSAKGKLRFLIVHLINWLITSYIICAGIVIAIQAKQVEWIYGFSALYLGMMLLHSPKCNLKPQI